MSSTETLDYMVQAAGGKHDAVAVNPALCDALFVKAFALVDLDRTAEAQTIFLRLVQLASAHSLYWAELGNTYRLQANRTPGLDAYRTPEEYAALADKEDAPNRACIALRRRGFMLVEQKRWDEAEAAYRKCLKRVPREPKSIAEPGYNANHRTVR